MLLSVAVTVLCIFALALSRLKAKSSKHPPLPPSPPGLPILGHVLQLPSRFLFRKLGEWQKQLGGIYSLSAGGRTIVVIGDAQVATDILDHMALVTSGRPSFPMYELMTQDMIFATNTYGDRWRQHRRIAQENLTARMVSTYLALQERGAVELVQRLSGPHSDLRNVLLSFSAKTLWRALYGEPPTGYEDYITRLSELQSESMKVVSPAGSLINMFPFLLRIPQALNPWKKYAHKFYKGFEALGMSLVMEATSSASPGGFVSSCLKAKENNPEMTEADIAFIAMTVFGAGSETVALTTYVFILALVLYPEVMRKAQDAVDTVAGTRLPTFQDRAQLPFIDAMIKEVMRWRTVGPLSLPHLATEDFLYRGYIIPKGAYLIPNIWYMDHNPDVFPEPDMFRPERFLDESGQLKRSFPADYHDGTIGFGYGRRMCPGREFARNELFITFATLIWSFDFCKALDARGREITPSPDAVVDEIVVSYPCPFPFIVKPRKDLSDALLSVP